MSGNMKLALGDLAAGAPERSRHTWRTRCAPGCQLARLLPATARVHLQGLKTEADLLTVLLCVLPHVHTHPSTCQHSCHSVLVHLAVRRTAS